MPTPDSFARLDNRIAVVTGSSSGIGRALALELARAGADVVLHCRKSIELAEKVAMEIRSLGRRSAFVQADLSNREEYASFVDRCEAALGPVAIWINNAGSDLLTGDAPRWPFEEKLDALLAVDVQGTVLLGREIGRRMKERGGSSAGGGAILNIGWDQADRGMEGDSAELFSTAKSAIMGFTRSLALSLAPEVRVNCIAPGWIRTAWGDQASAPWQERVLRETPLKRWGTPEDIARLARFLVSDDASYLTGQVVNANGGAVR